MARPFVPPPLTLAKAEPSLRPELTFQNKFTALADVPRLHCPTQPKLPKLLCPPQPKLINLRPTKPPVQEASSSSVQTKASYAMKTPESFAQAVNPELTKTVPTKTIPKEESFEFIVSRALPLMALNKEYESIDIGTLIKPCYTDFNYVDIENPLKTRRFYEAILIDTDSIEIEHSRDKILDPFEWFADHRHTPIALTMAHKPQTYNWYDYKAAWMNFLYLRPRHTWLPFPDGFMNGGTYLEELRKFLHNNFSTERIQHLCKQIQVKGWVPKQPNAKVQEKARSSSKKLSKAALKQKLKESMDNLDDYDEDQIMKMIEDAASTESRSEDNGDMCNPKGLALANMEHDYE
ncbi:hypothetical protein H5410_047790 [Solanum commersonii]|uniref:Uncharacterized protein n=1 Tax=Solanum commersonii TaxID=4109 RepID=A0A9J5XJA9_SOLCO|nr:hypothetical protein H5410_047790 [Solanum commersonii]